MVMLSATPIQLKSTDLFNLLHLLDEDAFPYEASFDMVLRMNAPIVSLRDKVLAGNMTREEFINAVDRIAKLNFYRDSLQVKHLVLHPPSEEVLASAKGRAELGDQLDRSTNYALFSSTRYCLLCAN
jgi:hypothetical protein